MAKSSSKFSFLIAAAGAILGVGALISATRRSSGAAPGDALTPNSDEEKPRPPPPKEEWNLTATVVNRRAHLTLDDAQAEGSVLRPGDKVIGYYDSREDQFWFTKLGYEGQDWFHYRNSGVDWPDKVEVRAGAIAPMATLKAIEVGNRILSSTLDPQPARAPGAGESSSTTRSSVPT